MKYQIFPIVKPSEFQLVWFIGPTAKETLGYFMGGTNFSFADNSRHGFYAKYWREADEKENSSSWNPNPEPVVKRKYTKRK